MNRIFSCSSQGIQKKCVVLCTLDTWNCGHIPWCPECISWFRSLPPKNIQRHKNLEHTFHCSDIFDCVFLPFPRKMGVYTKPRSGFGQRNKGSHLSRKSSRWKGEGIEGWHVLRKMKPMPHHNWPWLLHRIQVFKEYRVVVNFYR